MLAYTPHTVKSLREQGYKVKVFHDRLLVPVNMGLVTIKTDEGDESLFEADIHRSERGGRTIVDLTTPEGETLSGIAICHENDNYCKKTGVAVALCYALGTPLPPEKPKTKKVKIPWSQDPTTGQWRVGAEYTSVGYGFSP